MKKIIVLVLFSITSCLLKAQNMQPNFIFNQKNLEQKAKDFSEIFSCMGKYYEAVEKANVLLLENVFHGDWFMRDTDTQNEASLNVENKQKFIERVKNHGPYPGYAVDREFTSISTVNNKLAFVRISKNPSRNPTGFFLYKLNGKWIIMDKIWVNAKAASSAVNQSNSYSIIENRLHQYFEALATARKNVIDQMLHKDWEMKWIDSKGKLNKQSKSDFIERLKNKNSFMGYDQLRSIDLYHEKLAIVRIDIPSKLMTSFLIFFKINNDWKIVCERRSHNDG